MPCQSVPLPSISFLTCEAEAEQAQKQICAIFADEAEKVEGDARSQIFKARRQLKKGKQLSTIPFIPSAEIQILLDALPAVYMRREHARSELQVQFSMATEQTMQVLSEVAQMERFREAVMWQNREAVTNGIEHFQCMPNPTKKQREHAQLIAKYLQRYCTKNDSIGFFGPVGWGRWVPEGAALTVRPGPQLLATRTVYFETWGIDLLGETLAQDSALLPWAVPRPMPFHTLIGATLHIPFARPVQLSDTQACVLTTCDGQRTAREIAQMVLRMPCPGLASEADVFATLDHLRTTRRITWTFEVPMEDWYPERTLRRQLESITSEPLRQGALSVLEQLETARTAVAEAAGNVEQLNQALKHLEETFTNLTSKTASREAGKTYAARTLVYEDCRRDVELTFGPALLQELAHPLTLLLTSARWFTHMAARLYRKAFRKTYMELARKAGSSTVDFVTFWFWIQPFIPIEPERRLINVLIPELQKRWASVLEVPSGQRRVHYTSQYLQPRVQETFPAPRAGWQSARYHSPDVLIAATSPEAILRDEYQLVLGEFHQGVNTLDTIALAVQHPALSDLFQATAVDFPEPRVVPIFPGMRFSPNAHTQFSPCRKIGALSLARITEAFPLSKRFPLVCSFWKNVMANSLYVHATGANSLTC